jgi:hypothetical protein
VIEKLRNILFFSFEHKGFRAFGSGRPGVGLGVGFGIGRDFIYLDLRILNRGVDLQWEGGHKG